VAEVARTAEEADWDGLFVWDHLAYVWGPPTGDPWMLLTAAALATERLLLGTAVTPLPRRRLGVLAQQVTTLDAVAPGRVVFGAGIGGVANEYASFGEPAEPKLHGKMLDEGLDLLRRLWEGERVTHHGEHYTLDDVALAPVPKRVPIWIGGNSPRALRRAARFDGWIADGVEPSGTMRLTPDDVQRRAEPLPAGTEIAVLGQSGPADDDKRRAYEDAGATWWLESMHDMRGSFEQMLERAAATPAVT
jgi:alkanesulfonate monooxygenase SsuD/methylene tetrahydromethanopterin reductase-like flavin-dependent oxidoreductase (luciferase family)